MAAYQSRFFLSLVHASSKPPSRIGSPQLGSKGPSLRTVDLSLLDFQLDGLADGSWLVSRASVFSPSSASLRAPFRLGRLSSLTPLLSYRLPLALFFLYQPDQAAVESMPFDEMFGDMSNW